MSASERKIEELEGLLEESRREARGLKDLLGRQLGAARELTVESGVNASGVPFMRMRWGDEMGQLTPDEARTQALHILDAAAAAEFDATLVKVLTSDEEFGGLTIEHAMVMLQMMREARHGDTTRSA